MDQVDIEVLKKKKNPQMLFSQVGMNKTNLIKSADEIGLGDPDMDPKQSFSKAYSWTKTLSLSTQVYASHSTKPSLPPSMIFIPEKALLRKMIRWTAKCASIEELRVKFFV